MFNQHFSITYINDVVADTMDLPISMKVTKRSLSGRVKNLTVQYATNSKELEGYQIRSFLGWPAGKLLASTLFTLSTTDSSIVINGAGNGHGVGLCQYGAMYKSEKGLQYYHILQSYYPGTVLQKAY